MADRTRDQSDAHALADAAPRPSQDFTVMCDSLDSILF